MKQLKNTTMTPLYFEIHEKLMNIKFQHKESVGLFGSLWPHKLDHFGNLWPQKYMRNFLAIYGARNSQILAVYGP